MKRKEDHLVAWTLKLFLDNEKFDPELVILAPMVKASMLAMQAAKEFMIQKFGADKDLAYTVCGASKRGWTTWLVGGVTCESCPEIVGIFPLVPIGPSF